MIEAFSDKQNNSYYHIFPWKQIYRCRIFFLGTTLKKSFNMLFEILLFSDNCLLYSRLWYYLMKKKVKTVIISYLWIIYMWYHAYRRNHMLRWLITDEFHYTILRSYERTQYIKELNTQIWFLQQKITIPLINYGKFHVYVTTPVGVKTMEDIDNMFITEIYIIIIAESIRCFCITGEFQLESIHLLKSWHHMIKL